MVKCLTAHSFHLTVLCSSYTLAGSYYINNLWGHICPNGYRTLTLVEAVH